MPFTSVSCSLASVRSTVRIGPRQGVQPKAKANPITKAPIGVLLPFTLCSRASVYSALILKIPVRCSPKIMMTTPATIDSVCL